MGSQQAPAAKAQSDADAFAAMLGAVPWAWIGTVTDDDLLEIAGSGGAAERIDVGRLAAAWRGGTSSGGHA